MSHELRAVSLFFSIIVVFEAIVFVWSVNHGMASNGHVIEHWKRWTVNHDFLILQVSRFFLCIGDPSAWFVHDTRQRRMDQVVNANFTERHRLSASDETEFTNNAWVDKGNGFDIPPIAISILCAMNVFFLIEVRLWHILIYLNYDPRAALMATHI